MGRNGHREIEATIRSWIDLSAIFLLSSEIVLSLRAIKLSPDSIKQGDDDEGDIDDDSNYDDDVDCSSKFDEKVRSHQKRL